MQAGRMPGGRDFDAVFREGASAQGPFFVLRRRAASGARLGFAVGKRLDKRATVRNRVRRRLRAAFFGVELAEGDYVVVARAAALHADFPSLAREARRTSARFAEERRA
ncbi:MAG: ribonuclease P protein component [Dehalococcoidia bacterium]